MSRATPLAVEQAAQTDRAALLAEAARALVGTPFRLQGRDPVTGLDCLGLVLSSLDAVGVTLDLPADYRPHRRAIAIPHRAIRAAGLVEAHGRRRAGDVLLLRTGPFQAHAALALDRVAIVHAHAGLRGVVAGPLPGHWSVTAVWRLGPQPVPEGDTPWQP